MPPISASGITLCGECECRKRFQVQSRGGDLAQINSTPVLTVPVQRHRLAEDGALAAEGRAR